MARGPKQQRGQHSRKPAGTNKQTRLNTSKETLPVNTNRPQKEHSKEKRAQGEASKPASGSKDSKAQKEHNKDKDHSSHHASNQVSPLFFYIFYFAHFKHAKEERKNSSLDQARKTNKIPNIRFRVFF